MPKKTYTRILATIGPSSADEETFPACLMPAPTPFVLISAAVRIRNIGNVMKQCAAFPKKRIVYDRGGRFAGTETAGRRI